MIRYFRLWLFERELDRYQRHIRRARFHMTLRERADEDIKLWIEERERRDQEASRKEGVMDFDNRVFCWIVMVVALLIIAMLLWPRQTLAGYTCADVNRAAAHAGTSDLVGLERAARDYGIKITPALRRLARNCLKGEVRFAKRSFR